LRDFYNAKDSSTVVLAANLRDQNNQSNFLPKQQGSKIFNLKNGLKIGVIGLTNKEATSKFFANGTLKYKILDYAPVVIEESKKLRDQGAHAIVLLGNLGNKCSAGATYGVWYENTVQTETCDESG